MPSLTLRGLELRPADTSMHFTIHRGFDDVPEVRGKDDVAPALAGRVVRNRVADRLIIELRGVILGSGATEDAARQNYRATVNSLKNVLDRTLPPGDLVVYAPTMGLASGTATISVRHVNSVWGDWVAGLHRKVSIELECVSSPPVWTLVA